MQFGKPQEPWCWDKVWIQANGILAAGMDVLWTIKVAAIGIVVLVALLVLGKMISFMHR
jgi:hypothetical protein